MSATERLNLVCVLRGGPIRTIQVKGTLFRFEMHPRFGPMLVKKNNAPASDQRHRSFFWTAVSFWAQQGERVGDDGLCIWDYPPEEILEHKGGRTYLVVGYKPPVRGT